MRIGCYFHDVAYGYYSRDNFKSLYPSAATIDETIDGIAVFKSFDDVKSFIDGKPRCLLSSLIVVEIDELDLALLIMSL